MPAFKEAMDVGGNGNTCTQHHDDISSSGHQLNFTQKSSFTTSQYIPGIYMVYALHIPCGSHVRAFLVAHPHLEASDLDLYTVYLQHIHQNWKVYL